MRLVGLLLAVVATPSFASADVFGIGDGHSGPLDLSTCNGTAYVNEYTTLTSVTFGTLLSVGSAANFAAGDLVLVWQPAARGPATSGSQTEFALSGTTGQWELARVASVNGTNLVLGAAMLQQTWSHAQVVRVPEFAGVKIPATCSLKPGSRAGTTPQPWDGTKGGIVIFFSDDTVPGAISTSLDGSIDADGAGFQGISSQGNSASNNCGATDNLSVVAGGSFRGEGVTSTNFPVDVASGVGNVANAGGGGNCSQSAGGGGSNAGLGGVGGAGTGSTFGGKGGAPIAWRNVNSAPDAVYSSQALVVNGSLVTRFTFGGAGGHGQMKQGQGSPGGNGGGVIFIRANRLPGAGSLHANGTMPPQPTPNADGQGGGGGGGVLILRLEGALGAPCANLSASGGAGGSSSVSGVGAGGGGSGGRILLQASGACSTSVVTGGAGGTNGGGPSGVTGSSGSREQLPTAGVFCRDGSAASDARCLAANASLPRCDALFNFCAACGVDANCVNPLQPKCDLYNGVCRCNVSADCPPSAPACGSGGTCTAACQTSGGDALCSASYGNIPGLPRFCETTNATGKLGQCAPCKADSSQCDLSHPVCTADSCVPCDAATASVCSTSHGGLLCDTTSGSCVQCTTAATCASGQGCVSNLCAACSNDASCVGSAAGPFCSAGVCGQCRSAGDCAGGQGCVNHTCTACNGDPSCAGSAAGLVCVGGACVVCGSGFDCTSGKGCVSQMCTACNGDPSCTGNAAGPFCVGGACVACRSGGDCSSGQGCASHTCGQCAVSGDCTGNAGGAVCSQGVCGECASAATCTMAKGCVNHACVACVGDMSCQGSSSGAFCVAGACAKCRSPLDCGVGQACKAGVCGACSSDPDCAGGTRPYCVAGSCSICRDASACTTDQGCTNGSCGLCQSDSACTGSAIGPRCSFGGCVQCTGGGDCPGGKGCVNNVCAACVAAADCTGNDAGAACDQGACVPCASAADCTGANGCVSHACAACTDDSSCQGSLAGPHCVAGACSGALTPDAGVDAGTFEDAGAPEDAGSPDDAGLSLADSGTPDSGMGTPVHGGCGCGAGEGLFALLAVLALARRRRAG